MLGSETNAVSSDLAKVADLARASAKRDRLERPACVGPDRRLQVEANQ